MGIVDIVSSCIFIMVSTTLSVMSLHNDTLRLGFRESTYEEIPKSWRDYCLYNYQEGSNTTNLNCKVKNGMALDITDLRNLSGDMTINLNISLLCELGGNLILPMPVRVPRIVSLSIDNCNLLETNSETFDKDIAKLQNKVKFSKITNSVRILDDKYLKIMLQKSDVDSKTNAKCGLLNAEVIIERNITTRFKIGKAMVIQFGRNLAKMTRSFTSTKGVCIYKYLKVYDNSQNPTLGMNPVGSLLQSSSFPNLQIMNLSKVNLNEIPHHLRRWRLYFPKINYLDLSYNNLGEVNRVIDTGRYDENSTIGVIDLRHNEIKVLTKKNLESFLRHKFVKIDVRDNPFVCDCRMNTVTTFLSKNKHKLPKQYEYLFDLRCTLPTSLGGRRIMELSEDDLGCEKSSSKLETKTIIILSALSVIFLIIAVIFIIFRNEIPVLFFTRIYIHINCGSLKASDDKSFDAFIVFSEENEDWVIRTLIPRLEHAEKPPSFTVCIQQRDFVLGAPIVDNIFSCVKNSRHSILIISKAFLRSEWCMMEFRAALQQSLKERTNNLIMVLYEDISDMEIDEDLQRYLNTVTYVKMEDRLFWDKLVYALSTKQKKSKRKIFQIEEIEMKLQSRFK